MTSSPGQEKCLWIVQILNQFQKVTENVQFMDMIDGGSKSGPEEVAFDQRVYTLGSMPHVFFPNGMC